MLPRNPAGKIQKNVQRASIKPPIEQGGQQ
jgi:hypothetical protein